MERQLLTTSIRYVPMIIEDTEFTLSIYYWQDRFHPETLMHINLQGLRLLAPADQEKDGEIEHDP